VSGLDDSAVGALDGPAVGAPGSAVVALDGAELAGSFLDEVV
jgi:hypothetical protein